VSLEQPARHVPAQIKVESAIRLAVTLQLSHASRHVQQLR
jgi:hypothetical protein